MEKTENIHIEKLTITNAHRTPAELFVAAMAVTGGAITSIGLAIFVSKLFNIIPSFF